MTTVISTIVSFALFLGGMYLFGIAAHVTGYEALTFFGGIIAVSLAMAIPAHLLSRGVHSQP